MREGDTVEIREADDGSLVGKQGIIIAIYNPIPSVTYFAVNVFDTSNSLNRYWTAPYLKLVETYEQASARMLGEEYFA